MHRKKLSRVCYVGLALIILIAILAIINPNIEMDGILSKEEYKAACPNPMSRDDYYFAEVVLRRAGIDFDQAFIFAIDDETDQVCIYYKIFEMKWRNGEYQAGTDYRKVYLRVEGFAASEFVRNFDERGYFCAYYNEVFEWDFALGKDGYLTHHIVVSPSVKDSLEDYEIMYQKKLVETECELIDQIRKKLPFTIKNGECFFVLDESTRMVGWFYFKTTYNGESFVGCYEVDGWPGGTTYEGLINMDGLSIQGMSVHSIWVGDEI